MKLLRVALRSLSDGLCYQQVNRPMMIRSFSTNADFGTANENGNPFESTDDFERRLFGEPSDDSSSSFYRKLDRIEKARFAPGMGSNLDGGTSGLFDGNDDSFSSLTDGMDGKLKKAATYFEVNPDETVSDDYTFRPDMNLRGGMTYTPEDLNLTKPGVWKPGKRSEFEVTTKEVLRNADFRNVRFLANFLTEAGIIIKRSKTGISAKAQRKIAREIKTARAFGLLPFTTMGTKAFMFGRTMEDLNEDFERDSYESQVDADEVRDPLAE